MKLIKKCRLVGKRCPDHPDNVLSPNARLSDLIFSLESPQYSLMSLVCKVFHLKICLILTFILPVFLVVGWSWRGAWCRTRWQMMCVLECAPICRLRPYSAPRSRPIFQDEQQEERSRDWRSTTGHLTSRTRSPGTPPSPTSTWCGGFT